MPLRILEIAAPDGSYATVRKLAKKHEALDSWHSAKNKDGRRITRILVRLEQQQALIDALHKALYNEDNWRIVVLPVEAAIPKQEALENGKKKSSIPREELYNDIEKAATTDSNFLLLVFLSAVVCAIGLIENNIAVVIGAMVIAPLLGPNLALSFGAALGDRSLMIRAAKSNITGVGLTLAIAIVTGLIMNVPLTSSELISRTVVGFDSIALALAAGAAAVLSLTTGLSSTLVGVMVAVALMPPAITLGLFLGVMELQSAYGAGLLLVTNIVCVSLSAQLVFLAKGIKPRTWYMRQKSKQSVKLNIAFWVILLATLMVLIALRAT